VNRTGPRWLSVLGDAAIVLALSKVHAAWVADPAYDFTGSSRFGWALALVAVLAVTTYGVGLPDEPRSTAAAAGAAVVAAVAGALAVSIAQLVVGDALLPRFVVFSTAVLTVPWQVALHAVVRRSHRRGEQRDRLLVVAPSSERARLAEDLHMEPEGRAAVVGGLDPAEAVVGAGADLGSTDGVVPLVAAQQLANATLVVIDRSALTDDRIVAQAATLHESGVRVRTLLGFYEEWLAKLPVSELERASLLFDIGEVHGSSYGRVKRVIDLLLATVGAVVLLAVTPLVALGNLVANRGPLLYRQTRVGKGGRHFTIYKFRTMRPDGTVGGDGRGAWTETDDPRITPFGRFLRRSHLDELPQVLNVLRGDLSVVGPRPEQPHYVEELSAKLPFYDLRHLVRPGITGWAQVKYGYAGDERDALEKLQYEFFYLRHQDLRFDARIMVKTLGTLGGGTSRGR